MHFSKTLACLVLISGIASAATSVTLTSSANSVVLGHSVTLTASVNPTSASGSVTFYDGSLLLGTRSLSGGTATFTTNLLPSGPNSLKAYYAGDSGNGAASSTPLPLGVTTVAAEGFLAPVTYSVASYARSVVMADFNGDGKADLATADESSNSVSVLVGNGDGTFQPQINSTVATSSSSRLVAGDFNGDGKIDLAITNDQTNHVSILLGNGDGTFQSPVNYTAGTTPASLAVADFNGDGKADLVVANWEAASINVLLGKGDGTFLAAVSYPVGQGPLSIAVGDLNGDGKADLAVADSADGLDILLGAGDGSFSAATPNMTAAGPSIVAVGDFNGDGKQDIASVNLNNPNVSLLLGKGDGTFSAAVDYFAGVHPFDNSDGIGVGDFNGDGFLDIVLGNEQNNVVFVLLGNGDGTLQPGVSYPSAGVIQSFAVGDFNGDGRTDIAASGISSSVSVLLGRAPYTTTTLTTSVNPSNYGQSVTLTAIVSPAAATGNVTFFDGASILGTSPVTGGQATMTTSLLVSGTRSLTAQYLGDATRTGSVSSAVSQKVMDLPSSSFQVTASYPAGDAPTQLARGDLNGDGIVDLVAVNPDDGAVNVLLGKGDGSFKAPVSYSVGTHPDFVAIGDFNDDGKPDLAVANASSSNISVLLGKGDGTFLPAVSFSATGSPVSIAVGDFNGDGKADLAIAVSTGVNILLGNGDGAFSAAISYVAGTSPSSLMTGDFNRDGKTDLAVANSGSANVSILFGDGDGTFRNPANYSAGSGPSALATADFNSDGIPDLAVTNKGDGTVSVFLGNSDGTFRGAVPYAVAANPGSIAVEDFNGDEIPDLLVADAAGGGSVSVLIGKGDGTFLPVVNYILSGAPGSVIVGDFNGDGRTDFAVTIPGSNSIGVLIGQAPVTTTTTLTSSQNPSVFGHDVALTATISLASATGSVTFYDGAVMLGAASVMNGQATLHTTLLAAGTRSIRAFYLGGTGLPSHSAAFTQVVNQLPEAGFDFQVTYSASNQPGPIVTGDFNRDGRPDLALIDDLSVAVLLNKGDGVYSPAVHYSLNAQLDDVATGVAVGDLNADGNPDLVVSQDNSVYILLGNGDGTFQTPLTIVVGGPLSAVAIGDFNGDGKADLAVSGGRGAGVLLGNGDGTFQTVLPLATGSYSVSVVVGDFNKDGKTDLALVNADYSSLPNANTMGVLLGNGDGTFQTAVNYAAGNNLKSIAAGDLNGDGNTDLVTVSNSDNAVSIFLGTGDGTFQPQTAFPAGNAPVWVAVGDIDGDGKPDLVVADSNTGDVNNPFTVSILRGGGNGTFQTPVGYAVGSAMASAVVADLNNDGRADLAVAAGNGVQILRGIAPSGQTSATLVLTSSGSPVVYGQTIVLTGTLTPATATGVITFYDGSELLGDAVVSGGAATFSISSLSSGSHMLKAVYSGNATYAAVSSLLLPQIVNAVPALGVGGTLSLPVSQGANSVAVGDLNGDGRPDLVVGNTSSITVFLGLSGGGYAAGVNYSIPEDAIIVSIAIGDFNEDGKPDLVATGDGTPIDVFLGNGDGTFKPQVSSPGGGSPLFIGDFNRDGHQDIAAGGGVLFGNGDGTFSSEIVTAAGSASNLVMADFNGDGLPDFAGITVDSKGKVWVNTFDGNGDGTFAAPQAFLLASGFPAGVSVQSIAVADFNGDGNIDLAITIGTSFASDTNASSQSLTVLLGNGDGTLRAGAVYSLSGSPGPVVVGDFNGDGKIDIAVAITTYNSGSLTYDVNLYYGKGDGTFQQPLKAAASGPTGSLVVGDFNADGRLDIVGINTSVTNSATVNFYFGLIPSSIALASSSNPSIYGRPVMLTATVSPSAATGSISFYSGATILGTASVVSGQATLTIGVLPGGRQLLKAIYSGDATHPVVISPALQQTVTSISQDGVAAAGSYATALTLLSMGAGDFDGDGKVDLVVGTVISPSYSPVFGAGFLHGNGDGTFRPPVAFSTNYGISGIVAADFNGDGKLDFVSGSGVFLGNGDGTFRAMPAFNNGTPYSSVAVADFNGDGKADLAITIYNSVGVLLGNGDGTFRSGPGYATGNAANAVALGDFNGDGVVDLVVANQGDNNVSVLLGNGDGSFRAAVNYTSGGATLSVAVGDFNGDGKSDLAFGIDVNNAYSIGIRLGNGDGTFGPEATYTTGGGGVILVSDFNGDEVADLAVGSDILYGNGDGTFSAPVNFGVQAGVSSDFNGDGRADIAAFGSTGGIAMLLGRASGPDLTITKSHVGTFSVNQGGFTYSLSVSNVGNAQSSGMVTVTDTLPTGLTATSISGPNWTCSTTIVSCTRSDPLAASSTYETITVTVSVAANASPNVTNSATVSGGGDINLFNNTASDPTVISPVGQTPQTITFTSPGAQTGPASIDLTGSSTSGLTLIYTSVTPSVCTVSGSVATVHSVGTCSITASQPGNPTYAAAIPVTRTFAIQSTGLSATVTLTSQSSPVFLGQPLALTATVAPSAATGHVTFYDGVNVLGIAAIANGNATLTTSLVPSGKHSLHVHYSGDPSYGPASSPVITRTITPLSENSLASPANYAVTGAWLVAQGDFNGDGKTDLAVTSQAGNAVSLLLGNGDGTFQTAVPIATVSGSSAIAAGDFNGDGRTDLVVSGVTNDNPVSGMNILLNNGDGTFTSNSIMMGYVASSLATTDFNGDGILDIGVTSGNAVFALLGNGDGTFLPGVMYGFPVMENAAVEDFNGDGKPDFVIAGGVSSGLINILLGNGDRTLQNPVTYTVGSRYPQGIVAGDLNGDGKPDIAVAGYTGTAAGGPGVLSVFLNNGDGTFQPALNYTTGLYPRAVLIADMNGDSTPDLVLSNQYDNTIDVFLGVGDGTFQAGVTYPVGSQPMGIVAGDFNGDGGTDLAVANSADNTVGVLLGKVLPSQTINFPQLSNVSFGIAPFIVSATASSGLTVTFASTTISVCTVSVNTVTVIAAGTCSISASQSGNANFGAAPPVLNTFVVNKGSQTITFAPLPDDVFGTSQNLGPGLNASASSGLQVTFTSNTPPVCSVYSIGSDMVGAGLCSITATQAGDSNYNSAAPVTQTFTITKGTQNINFPQPAGSVFGIWPVSATPVTLAATADSGLPVTYTSSTTSVCTVSTNSLTFIAVGSCMVTANQAGNANYQPATSPLETYPVGKGSQTITFNQPSSGTVGSSISVTATATSTLTVVLTSNTTTVCTVSGTTVTPLTQGTCSVTATQPGNTNYLAATAVTQSFTINPAPSSGGGGGGGGAPAGGGTPLTISPASVTISAATGGSPGTQTITLSYPTFTQGAPSFSTNFNLNQGQGWLSVSPATGTMSLGSTSGLLFTYTATLTISGDPAKLTAGNTYTGTVNVSSAGSIVSVPVTLNVTSQPAKYTVAPQSLNFSYQQGSTTQPATQSLSVFSTPAGGTFTANATSAGNWLTVETGTTTPESLAVSVNTAGLQPNTYSGTIAITAGTSVNITVPVTLTITKASPPILAVSPASQNLNVTQGSPASTGQITVSNTGGGTLQFTASSDQSWLTTASSGSATPGSPASLAFTTDPSTLTPGVYTGHISVSGSGASQNATIVLTVTNTAARIQIAQTGISMTAAAGGSAPQPQTVPITNSGSGTLNWSAQTSTTSGGNWLAASQNGGSVTISANTTGLAAGQYYGSVNIISGSAANSPQTISVALNLLAATAAPGVITSTGGILLEGTGTVTQSVNLYNPGSSAVTYSAGTLGSWLSVNPVSGSANPGSNSITISADLTKITGVQQGSVTLGFGDGNTASIRVVALALGASGHVIASLRPMLATTTCAAGKADYLIPVFREPAANSSAQVASATTVQLQLVDDCGNNVSAANGGSAQIAFSNGDPGLTLNDIGSGIWEATWVPQNAAKSVTLQAVAMEKGLSIGSSVSALSSETVTVSAAGANAPPAPTGIANAASAAQATPQVVAPGSYIAIYGTSLAGTDNPSATALPLPTNLNGTQLYLGGLPMPLLYAGAGQVNALVPDGIAPNATYPLTVVRGTTQSVPVPITVTELQPGAYTVDTSGSGAGIVTNALTGALITNSNPAHAGDFLVIYATGLGQLTGQNGETEPPDGAAAPATTIYHTNANVAVNIGGTTVPAVFAGLTPSLAGLYQVNIQVPQGVTTGTAVPLQIIATDTTTGTTATGNTVTIAIQ